MELAHSLHHEYDVIGSKRRLHAQLPFQFYRLDFRDRSTLAVLPKLMDADYLILNIPPSSAAENVRDNYHQMLDLVIDRAKNSPLKRLIFISSTGVFGGNSGIVHEFTKPIPAAISGKVLREAEEEVLKLSNIEPVVLRPAGLVGGQRHPANYLAGRKNVKGQHQVVNLVHRDDLVTSVKALIKRRKLPGDIFHACSSQHPNKKEFYQRVAIKLGIEPPVFDQNDMNTGKEISSDWSKQCLGISYKFEDPFTMHQAV